MYKIAVLYLLVCTYMCILNSYRISYFRLGRAAAFFSVFGVTSNDVAYTPLPLYHSAALMTFNGSSLLMGVLYVHHYNIHHTCNSNNKNNNELIDIPLNEICKWITSKQFGTTHYCAVPGYMRTVAITG